MPSDTGTEPRPGSTTKLMDSLIPLGQSLPESHKPAPATLSHLLAGLLYWLETGSTEPPPVEEAPTTVVTTKDAEIAALKAELEAATNAANATPVAASPVAPSPVAESPAVAQPVQDSTPVPAAVPVPAVGDVPSAPAS